ncbi:hypothetical protein EI94DRAFT_473467 [Lactarius quietus]|nr:hypothetical protein EI94DRAFT_473467 [Lactarius quietus]
MRTRKLTNIATSKAGQRLKLESKTSRRHFTAPSRPTGGQVVMLFCVVGQGGRSRRREYKVTRCEEVQA